MISNGTCSIGLRDILDRVSEADILYHYFGVNQIPCVIPSPLRVDRNPSFGLYTKDGVRIFYKDLAKHEEGGIWDLLGEYWGLDYNQVLERVWKELPTFSSNHAKLQVVKSQEMRHYSNSTDLQCRIRDWQEHDIAYWKEFGIDIKWLKYADIYPISHKIVIKDKQRYIFPADKYAYAYVERKEGKVTLKIYQPFNKTFKWSNKHDSSVISLWTKVPERGDRIIICSSMKDALCAWANTGVPCIAIQGEGYLMSNTAISELRRRYKRIYILLDNDEAGLEDGVKLANHTGFTNLVLPDYGAKDISDLYKLLKNKDKFRKVILTLIKEKENQNQL